MKLRLRDIEARQPARIATRFAFDADAKTEGRFTGKASLFGEVDSYGTAMAPGAFAASLAQWQDEGRKPAMLWQHDRAEPIGRWLSLQEDGEGLKVEGQLELAVSRAREALALMAGDAPAVDGLSVGFIADDYEIKGNVLVFTRVTLLEVSIVTFPACWGARIEGVRADPDSIATTRELEALLRDAAGYSRAHAREIASRFTAKAPRDAGDDLAALLPGLNALAKTLAG